MSWTRRFTLAAALGALLASAGPAQAKAVVVPPRPGQVGLSVTGLYGTLLQSGEFGRGFSSGPGLAVQLRYRMRYERGFGLSFETHGFDVRPDARFPNPDSAGRLLAPDDPTAPKKLSIDTYGVDFYQMFGTRTKTTRMLSVGAGLMHSSRTLNDGDTEFDPAGSDGVYVGAGAGVENFFWQSWAWELGARYHAVFHGGRVNHDFQAALGLAFYASL